MVEIEKIIKQISQNIIDINYKFEDITESDLTDDVKIMRLSNLIGNCIGLMQSKKIDLINIIENGKDRD